jgi:hypothetical protein
MIRLVLLLIGALLAAPVLAQGTLQQAGPVASRHALGVVQNGILADSGYANGTGPNNGVGVGLAELLKINPTSPSGPFGTNDCTYDFPVTNAAGYHYLCTGISSTAGILAFGAAGPAAQLPLQFIVNGTVYTFPFSSSGSPSAIAVTDTVALQALSVVPLAPGIVVTAATYNASTGQNAPPVGYYLITPTSSPNSCTVDNGSCFASNTAGYYWHITPQTVYDVRWWGAYEDVQRVNSATVTTTANNAAVTIAGGSFVSADANGKRIVITDGIASPANTPNGSTYSGTIGSVTNATNISVSPAPAFTTNQTQYVYWGHDDAAAWNSAIAFMNTIAINGTALGGQPVLTGAGHASGVFSAPVIINTNLSLTNTELVALGSTNFPLSSSGVLEIGGAFSYGQNIIVDGAWLPVNPVYSNANGTIWWSNVRAKNWLGSSSTPTVLTGASTNIEATTNSSIGSCTGTGPYTCTLTVNSISTTGLAASPVGAGGSGYAVGDLIFLTQSGGTQVQQAVARVNIVVAGVVTSATISKSGLFTANPTSFSQASTTGGGTGFTITAPVFATSEIQPGQSLSDNNVNVPAGTYVTAFGTATGGTGTYTIQNATSNPGTVSSQTIRAIGLDVTVTGGSTADVGLVSRGNSLVGVADRTFAVAYVANQITLNKAPTQEFSNATLTFNQDSNGVYLGPTAGVQITNLTVSQDDFQTIIGNHYGCALNINAAGGSTLSNGVASFGIANVCEGPTAANVQFSNKFITTGAAVSGGIEVNSPTVLLMDGANTNLLSNFNTAGQVQVFAVSAASNTIFSMLAPVISTTSGQVMYAPNNTVWYYTEQNNLSTSSIVFTGPGRSTNTVVGTPQHVALTSGSAGSYKQFSPSQLAGIANAPVVNMPATNASGAPMQPNGLNLYTTPLYGAEPAYVQINGNYTIPESDTGASYDITAAATVTIPNTIGSNSVNGFLKSSFLIPSIVSRTGSTVTIAAGSGTTLYYQGQSTSSVTLQEFYKYSLSCPRNTAAGTGAICTLSLDNAFVTGGLPTVAAGAAAGTSPTVTLTNTPNDAAMTLSVLTGTGPATGTLATVTFGQTWPSSEVPKCQLSPRNANAGDLTTAKIWAASTNSTLVVHVDTAALSATTTYLWDVLCQ